MAVSLTRKLSGAALLLVFLVGTALAFWPYVSASGDMRSFCGKLATGLPGAALTSAVASSGYDMNTVADGKTLVNDPRSFGRLKCWVSLDTQGRVVGTAFDGD